MSSEKYTVQKVLKIFGADVSRTALIKAETAGLIPMATREGGKSNPRRAWSLAELPMIGERYGFLKKLHSPIVASVFTTKGGVLKSTLALNLGRLAALHNQRVCIVGLDMQCDITNALGYQVDIDDTDDLESALDKLGSVQGLADFASARVKLDDIIIQSDIPTLHFIPETPELVTLERELSGRNMRDFWLRDKVIEPLKKRFDLVILDCSPNWNLLISNALMSCDALISPLECKINNFRNYQAFKAYLDNFKQDTGRNFAHIFVPTKFTSTRKLSSEIRSWYLSNVPGCTNGAIRESVHSEEAMAQHVSLPEYSANMIAADEMREVVLEVWNRLIAVSKKASAAPRSVKSKTPTKTPRRVAEAAR